MNAELFLGMVKHVGSLASSIGISRNCKSSLDTLCANKWLARKPDVRVHVQKNAEDAVKTDWNRVVRG